MRRETRFPRQCLPCAAHTLMSASRSCSARYASISAARDDVAAMVARSLSLSHSYACPFRVRRPSFASSQSPASRCLLFLLRFPLTFLAVSHPSTSIRNPIHPCDPARQSSSCYTRALRGHPREIPRSTAQSLRRALLRRVAATSSVGAHAFARLFELNPPCATLQQQNGPCGVTENGPEKKCG